MAHYYIITWKLKNQYEHAGITTSIMENIIGGFIMTKENIFLSIATVECVVLFATALTLRKAVKKEIKAKYRCNNLRDYFKKCKS